MCTYYKRHSSSCALRTHPDVNDDTKIECRWKSDLGSGIWEDGHRDAYAMGWRKILVPLERAAAEELLKAVPDKLHSGKTTVIRHVEKMQEETGGHKASDGTRHLAAITTTDRMNATY